MITEAEANAIARSVGKPKLEFAASIVAPPYSAQRVNRRGVRAPIGVISD
jgi:hypothetical protein